MNLPQWFADTFSRTKPEQPEQRFGSPYFELIPYFSPPTASGVGVTPEGALRATAVYACVRIISESVASLPLVLYEQDGRDKKRALTHPVYQLLHDQPNELQTAVEFREQFFANVLLRGTGFAEIIYGKTGRIDSLELIPTNRIESAEVRRGQAWYARRDDNENVRWISADSLLIMRGLSGDQLFGYSPIKLVAKQAVGLSLAAEQYGASFFGNSARPGGLLKHPGRLSAPAQERLRESFAESHQGPENAHRIRILEEGMEYQAVQIPPEEAQFLETRKFQVHEIARIYRVPPHMLADLERATFSNIEHQSIDFVVHTLRPWLVRFEQAIRRDLLTEAEKSRYFAKHIVEGLLRGDTASRYAAYATGIQNNILVPNEARELEDLNPLPGGDEFVQSNLSAQVDEMAATQNEDRAAISARFDGTVSLFEERQAADHARMDSIEGAQAEMKQALAETRQAVIETTNVLEARSSQFAETLTEITETVTRSIGRQDERDEILTELSNTIAKVGTAIVELQAQHDGINDATVKLAEVVGTIGEAVKQAEDRGSSLDGKMSGIINALAEIRAAQAETATNQAAADNVLQELQARQGNMRDVLDAVLGGIRDSDGAMQFAIKKTSEELRQDRVRVINRYVGLFDEVAGRLTRREIAEIRQAIRVDLERDGNIEAFRNKLETIYSGLRDIIPGMFERLMETLAEAIFESVGEELGQNAPSPVGLATFIDEYLANFAATHTVGGEKQLRALLEEAEDAEQATTLMTERMDGWEENRASKTALQQAYEAGNALSIVGYSALGVRELVWRGGDCPICRRMNGRRVRVGSAFADEGEIIDSGDEQTAPLVIDRALKHGPLHRGCDCVLGAG